MSLEILKKRLCALKEQVKKRKDSLTEHLKKKELISETDEAWLDNEANHVDEDAVIEDATDEDIFEAVQKMLNRKEDHKKNGHDDDEEVEPKLSRKEVLQATSILRQYVADLDDPFTRKMEAMLSTFGCETRREEAKTMVDRDY
jgi:hypothetical protein